MAKKYKNGDGKVFYGPTQILDYKGYSAEEMGILFGIYHRLLVVGEYDEARKINEELGLPKTGLCMVIAELIKKNADKDRGLCTALVKEFRDLGYNNSWFE